MHWIMSVRLCGSSIFTLVCRSEVTLDISELIVAGSRSTKNIGRLIFVVL